VLHGLVRVVRELVDEALERERAGSIAIDIDPWAVPGEKFR
jgi:hypothetical protein